MGYPARAFGVLFAVVALFFVARWLAGPGYLSLFSPDRSQSIERWASNPIQYMDLENCDTCHGERIQVWREAAHQGLNCESCHGPAQEHVDSGASLAIEEPSDLCIRCHARLESRPSAHPQVDVEAHAGDLSCTTCHNPHEPSLAGPPAVPHSLEGRTECTVCHGQRGVKPVPIDHAGRTKETCLVCHRSQDSSRPSGPPVVPHFLEGRSNCTTCHGVGALKPFPEDHAGRTSDVCLACHRPPESLLATPTPTPVATPEETVEPSGPPGVPHTLDGRSQCTVCHGVGALKPFPADHAGRTSDVCLACHRQQ